MNKILIAFLVIANVVPAFASEAKKEQHAAQKQASESRKADKRKAAAVDWYVHHIDAEKRNPPMPVANIKGDCE